MFEGLILFNWIFYYIVFYVCVVVVTKWGHGQTVAHCLECAGCLGLPSGAADRPFGGVTDEMNAYPFEGVTDELNVYHCCAVYVWKYRSCVRFLKSLLKR